MKLIWLSLSAILLAVTITSCKTPKPILCYPYVYTANVRDFGATGDGTNKDTIAFQKAFDACVTNGDGIVVVPPGHYLIGSVQMGRRTTLYLQKDSVIIGDGDMDDYPMTSVRWEGRWEPGHRGL